MVGPAPIDVLLFMANGRAAIGAFFLLLLCTGLQAQEPEVDELVGDAFLQVFNLSDEDIARLGCFDTLPPTFDLLEAFIDTTVLLSDSVAWSVVRMYDEEIATPVEDTVDWYQPIDEVFFLMSHTWPVVRPIQLLQLYRVEDDSDLEYEYTVIRPDLVEAVWGRPESDREGAAWLRFGERVVLIDPVGRFVDRFGDPFKP